MTSLAFPHLPGAMRLRVLRTRHFLQRVSRALAYVTGRLSPEDAQTIMLECRAPAGWQPLLVLTVEETLEDARRIYADNPALPALVAAACARVGSKWEDYSDAIRLAREYTIEIAEAHARQAGVRLIRWDEILPPDAPEA